MGESGADLEDQHQFWAELCLANMAARIADLNKNPQLPYFCIILSELDLELELELELEGCEKS